MIKAWLKPVFILLVLFLLTFILPNTPVDPWALLKPKKIVSIIFVLAFIQVMASVAVKFLGAKKGALFSGFFGGFISSTATTANLARQSKLFPYQNVFSDTLVFLAATLAMLFEGVCILYFAADNFHFSLLVIFIGPIILTISLMMAISKKITDAPMAITDHQLDILSILKLSAFIVLILALSKILQNIFGEVGLALLTFLVSLFEVHGSFVANIQMHDDGSLGVIQLGGLLAVSIAASYVSKLFLIYSLGSDALKKYILKYTILLFLSLLASWLFFFFVN
ncbi:DUF4010 domain-containing protein [bacterium]|nr:DUF4010 domain-containing protein [bacterium]